MSDPIIVEWVNATIAGDQDAFAEIVYTFQDAVYNLCYRMLGNAVEAEDAAQEAFRARVDDCARWLAQASENLAATPDNLNALRAFKDTLTGDSVRYLPDVRRAADRLIEASPTSKEATEKQVGVLEKK